MKTSMRRSAGFTLIELLAVMVVFAILTAISLPMYDWMIRKSRRVDATVTLQKVMQDQERWRSGALMYNNCILKDRAECDSLDNSLSVGPNSPETVNGYYRISITQVTAGGYTIVARPTTKGNQNKDTQCSEISLRMVSGHVSREKAGCWAQ